MRVGVLVRQVFDRAAVTVRIPFCFFSVVLACSSVEDIVLLRRQDAYRLVRGVRIAVVPHCSAVGLVIEAFCLPATSVACLRSS